MNRKLRWVGRGLAVLTVLVAGFGTFVGASTNPRLARSYDVRVERVDVPTTLEARAHGEHLVKAIAKCTDCHGDDLGGKVMVDSPLVGIIAAPNLTRGDLTTEDWTRAIMHGVGREHRALLVMPSEDYSSMGKDDLADLIAYVESLQPVDRSVPPSRPGPMLRTLMATGKANLLHAETIDHTRPLTNSPHPEANAIYGEYIARTGGCFGCHGGALAGGAIPGMPPGTPPASDIRPTGAMSKYDEESFTFALRHGMKPDGTELKAPMPWQATRQMNDTEMKALYLFLKQPPRDVVVTQR